MDPNATTWKVGDLNDTVHDPQSGLTARYAYHTPSGRFVQRQKMEQAVHEANRIARQTRTRIVVYDPHGTVIHIASRS